jgi:hypothetical protein
MKLESMMLIERSHNNILCHSIYIKHPEQVDSQGQKASERGSKAEGWEGLGKWGVTF